MGGGTCFGVHLQLHNNAKTKMFARTRLAELLKNHRIDRCIIVGKQRHVIGSRTASVQLQGVIQKRRGARVFFLHQ